MTRTFDRFVAHQPGPACDGLPDFARTRPRSPRWRAALTQVRVAALQHGLRLALGQDAVAKRDGEPHRLDDLQQFQDTDAQSGEVIARRRGAFGGQDGAGQYDGRFSWAPVSTV